MLAKYKGHITATLAVVVVMFIFAFIGALLDFKNAGGLVVQVPMFFLIVAIWGYVYSAFKPKEGKSVSVILRPDVAVEPAVAAAAEVRKYLHLSGLLNLVLAALLLASLLKVMAMQKTIKREERIPGYYTFMYMGEKRFATVDKVAAALNAGGVLLGQTTRGDYEKPKQR